MNQLPRDKAKQLAEQLLHEARRSEEFTKDSLRLAEELHRQGVETDQQLEGAKEIAARMARAREKVVLLAENVQRQASKPKVDTPGEETSH